MQIDLKIDDEKDHFIGKQFVTVDPSRVDLSRSISIGEIENTTHWPSCTRVPSPDAFIVEVQ